MAMPDRSVPVRRLRCQDLICWPFAFLAWALKSPRTSTPQVRGWINYYGVFYHSELFSLMRRIDEHLVRWAMHKFKRLRRRPAQAQKTLDAAQQRQPTLFAHWQLVSITRRRSVGAV